MQIIKRHVVTLKETVLAEADTLPFAKQLKRDFIKNLYDQNKYNDYIILIK